MPRASATHTQNQTHARSDSLLLYSGRGEWLTCGKFALGVEKEKKASEAVLCGMKSAMIANIQLLITACLLCPPPSLSPPLPANTPHPSSPSFSTFSLCISPSSCYTLQVSAREPVTLTKKRKSFKGWKFPQNTKGEVGEWVEVQVEEYRWNVVTWFSLWCESINNTVTHI